MLFSWSHVGNSFSLGSTESIAEGSFKVLFQELMTPPQSHPGEIQLGLSLGTAGTCVHTSLARKTTLAHGFFRGRLAKANSLALQPRGKNIGWGQKFRACLRITSQHANPHTHTWNSVERPG